MSLQAYVHHMYVLQGCGGMAAVMARHPRELTEPKHVSIHEEEIVWHSDSDKMSHKACGSHGNQLCCNLIPPSVSKGVVRIARIFFFGRRYQIAQTPNIKTVWPYRQQDDI
jgi:hypothetical protein